MKGKIIGVLIVMLGAIATVFIPADKSDSNAV